MTQHSGMKITNAGGKVGEPEKTTPSPRVRESRFLLDVAVQAEGPKLGDLPRESVDPGLGPSCRGARLLSQNAVLWGLVRDVSKDYVRANLVRQGVRCNAGLTYARELGTSGGRLSAVPLERLW